MKLLDRFNTMTVTSVLLAVLAFCIADGAVWLGVLAVPLVILGWVAGRERTVSLSKRATRESGESAGMEGTARTGPWTMPRLATNLLVFGAIANAALRAFAVGTGSPLVSQLGAFLVQVQIIKLFDRRGPRDDGQVLSLSLFIVIATILTNNTLAVGLLLAAYTPLATGATMLLQIRAGVWALGARDVTDRQAGDSPRRRMRNGPATLHGLAHSARTAASHFLRLVTAIVISTLALGIAVFFVTPRGFGAAALGNFGLGREGRTGYTDSIQLGKVGSLSDSPTPVMDVLVQDSEGSNVGSIDRAVYLRGTTSSEYSPETHAWLPGQNWGATDLQPNEPLELGLAGPQHAMYKQTITPRSWSRSRSPLFAAWKPLKLKVDQPLRVSFRPDLTIRQEESHTSRARYWVWSSRMETADAMDAGNPPRATFKNPRVKAEAERILRELGISGSIATWDAAARRAVIIAFRDHLRENYNYTTEGLAPPGEQDPIEWFLFDRKAGHCEYFASAMVGLCQSIGIPARLVGGYVATEFNTLTGWYLVRESNAHAWVEAYLGDGRWFAEMDPSPPADIQRLHKPAPGLFATLRRWYDTLEFNWANSVVGFDVSRQSQLFDASSAAQGLSRGGIGRTLERWGRRVLEVLRMQRLSERISPGATFLFGAGSILLAGVIVLTRAIRRRRSKRARRWSIDPQAALLLRHSRFYPQALRLLERAGLGKPDTRTIGGHARTLRHHDPALAENFETLATAHQMMRFGGRALAEPDAHRAQAALEQLRVICRRLKARPAPSAAAAATA